MFQIQISKRRQKFTTRYTFTDRPTAEAWFKLLRPGKNERVRLAVGSVEVMS